MRRTDREQEFSDFFLARGPALRRTAYLIVHDWHTAEDLTQQAFVTLYAAWPRVRRESADAYARRTVVNRCLSHLRRHRPELPTDRVPERPGSSAGSSTGSQDDGPLDLGAALALLPPRQRAIVALRFLDDQSVADTAAALGIAEGTVKSQTSRALDTLRTHLPDLVLTEESR